MIVERSWLVRHATRNIPLALSSGKKRNKKDRRRLDCELSNVPKSTSCNCTSQGASSSTWMIVSVWLSSSKRPEEEVLVYAILDTQSDSTFILKETCDELDADKQPSFDWKLSLVKSQSSTARVSGLQVRGYYSDLKIPIPVAYTSTSIPVDEDHILTTTTAKNWSHLRLIEDKCSTYWTVT